MNHPKLLCATALLAALLGNACDDNDDTNDSDSGALRPNGGAGGTAASTNTGGSGGGAGSSSTGVPGGASGAANAGASGATSMIAAAGAAGQGTAVASPDAGVGSDGETPSLSADAGAVDLSDGQILTVANTLNAGEVEQAQAALPRLVDENVQAFANDMVTEHTAAQQDLQSFAQTHSELATQLANRGAANVAALTAAPAESVDALYIDQQVSAHGEALQLIDQLIDAVDAPLLEAQLVTLRSSVAAHRNRASELAGLPGQP
jgi:putative membrane protein